MTSPPTPLPRIFFVAGTIEIGHAAGIVGFALAEDGVALGEHVSSTRGHAAADLVNEWHQAAYRDHYPDGFAIINLTDLVNPEDDTDYSAALAKNKAIAQAEGEIS